MRNGSLAVLALCAFAASGSLVIAQEKPKIVNAPIKATQPTDDAKAMFNEYCASCHGKDAKGSGPAAAALKKVPADLTKISARNGGTFPEVKVDRFIEGSDEIAAHGNRDMPVWGNLFKTLPGGPGAVPIRIKNLREYLKSIQQ